MKKVSAGDPLRIPAGAYNSFVDAAEAHKAGRFGWQVGEAGVALPTGVAWAYNASGEDAPMYGVAELSSTEGARQFRFVKPASGAEGVYAIILEPIVAGEWGMAAVSAGAWPIYAVEVELGDVLGPVDGFWTPGVKGIATWEVIRPDVEQIALVRFLAGTVASETGTLLITQQEMGEDDVAYDCDYIMADGTHGAEVECKRPPGLTIPTNTVGLLARDPNGERIFFPANMRSAYKEPLYAEMSSDPGSIPAGRIVYRTE